MNWRELKAYMEEKCVKDEDEITFVHQLKDRGQDARTRLELADLEMRMQPGISPTNHHARLILEG